MLAVIEHEVVDKYHWVKKEEFLDLVVLAQTAPGILAVNISILTGNKVAGKRGALVAALGAVLPSFIIESRSASRVVPSPLTRAEVTLSSAVSVLGSGTGAFLTGAAVAAAMPETTAISFSRASSPLFRMTPARASLSSGAMLS